MVCGLEGDVPESEDKFIDRKLPGGCLVGDIQDVQQCKPQRMDKNTIT
jgi:hypothetical protein